MISTSEFSFQDPECIEWIADPKSRFSEVAKIERTQDLNIEVDIETIFLSSGVTYAAYLVFKYYDDSNFQDSDMSSEPILVGLRYKLKDMGGSSISYLAELTDDGWMLIELCQFVSHKKVAKLEASLESFSDYNGILLEGIQFLPVDKATKDYDDVEVEKKDINAEQELPSDYRHIIKMAKDHVPYNISNKELYLLLSNGILINKGQALFYLDKDGVKCCMQAAQAVLKGSDVLECFRWISVRQSRFEKVAECQSGNYFQINCNINSHMLSPKTTYATYLVYKLPEVSHQTFECPLEVKDSDRFYSGDNKVSFIFLTNPTTPVISPKKDDGDRDHRSRKNPMARPKMEGIPKERKDGWMETQIWAFTTDVVAKTIHKEFKLSLCDYGEELTGLIVQGIEIRPK